jgi:hypothetical protein
MGSTEGRVGRVHTTAGDVVHIGASATDDAFIDAFAEAARVGRLRVHEPERSFRSFENSLELLRRIQALAESLDYECWWQLGIGVDHADLILLEVD